MRAPPHAQQIEPAIPAGPENGRSTALELADRPVDDFWRQPGGIGSQRNDPISGLQGALEDTFHPIAQVSWSLLPTRNARRDAKATFDVRRGQHHLAFSPGGNRRGVLQKGLRQLSGLNHPDGPPQSGLRQSGRWGLRKDAERSVSCVCHGPLPFICSSINRGASDIQSFWGAVLNA